MILIFHFYKKDMYIKALCNKELIFSRGWRGEGGGNKPGIYLGTIQAPQDGSHGAQAVDKMYTVQSCTAKKFMTGYLPLIGVSL